MTNIETKSKGNTMNTQHPVELLELPELDLVDVDGVEEVFAWLLTKFTTKLTTYS